MSKPFKHLYVCGPMTGLPSLNYPAFDGAAAALRAAGYRVSTPTENGVPQAAPWSRHMRADIKLLMDCDAVAVLDGTAHSTGAQLELHNATQLAMPVLSVAGWLQCAATGPSLRGGRTQEPHP